MLRFVLSVESCTEALKFVLNLKVLSIETCVELCTEF